MYRHGTYEVADSPSARCPCARPGDLPVVAGATANAADVALPACVTAQARAHAVVDLAGWWTN